MPVWCRPARARECQQRGPVDQNQIGDGVAIEPRADAEGITRLRHVLTPGAETAVIALDQDRRCPVAVRARRARQEHPGAALEFEQHHDPPPCQAVIQPEIIRHVGAGDPPVIVEQHLVPEIPIVRVRDAAGTGADPLQKVEVPVAVDVEEHRAVLVLVLENPRRRYRRRATAKAVEDLRRADQMVIGEQVQPAVPIRIPKRNPVGLAAIAPLRTPRRHTKNPSTSQRRNANSHP